MHRGGGGLSARARAQVPGRARGLLRGYEMGGRERIVVRRRSQSDSGGRRQRGRESRGGGIADGAGQGRAEACLSVVVLSGHFGGERHALADGVRGGRLHPVARGHGMVLEPLSERPRGSGESAGMSEYGGQSVGTSAGSRSNRESRSVAGRGRALRRAVEEGRGRGKADAL